MLIQKQTRQVLYHLNGTHDSLWGWWFDHLSSFIDTYSLKRLLSRICRLYFDISIPNYCYLSPFQFWNKSRKSKAVSFFNMKRNLKRYHNFSAKPVENKAAVNTRCWPEMKPGTANESIVIKLLLKKITGMKTSISSTQVDYTTRPGLFHITITIFTVTMIGDNGTTAENND